MIEKHFKILNSELVGLLQVGHSLHRKSITAQHVARVGTQDRAAKACSLMKDC